MLKAAPETFAFGSLRNSFLNVGSVKHKDQVQSKKLLVQTGTEEISVRGVEMCPTEVVAFLFFSLYIHMWGLIFKRYSLISQ